MKFLITQSAETVVANSYDSCPTGAYPREKGGRAARPPRLYSCVVRRCSSARQNNTARCCPWKTTHTHRAFEKKRRCVTFEEFLWVSTRHLRTIKTRNRKVCLCFNQVVLRRETVWNQLCFFVFESMWPCIWKSLRKSFENEVIISVFQSYFILGHKL